MKNAIKTNFSNPRVESTSPYRGVISLDRQGSFRAWSKLEKSSWEHTVEHLPELFHNSLLKVVVASRALGQRR